MGLSMRHMSAKATEWIPARLVVSAMVFFGSFNLYMVRVNLSICIVAMVRQHIGNDTLQNGDVQELERDIRKASLLDNETLLAMNDEEEAVSQSTESHQVSSSKDMEDLLDWDEATQGLILGSFFYGYTLTQIIGGRLAEKFGSKIVFGICILSGGISAVLTPVAARAHFGLIMALRFLQGIMQGVGWPSLHILIVRWIPPLERGRFIAIVYNASAIGTTIALPLCGFVIDAYGWPAAFYLTGGLSLIWVLWWILFMFDFPEKHPRISREEKEYIENSIRQSGTSEVVPSKIPVKKMAKSLPLWAIIVGGIGNDFGFSLFVTHIPTYMQNILGFSITQNGLLSSAPFISRYTGGVIASSLSDWMLKKKLISIINNRRLFSAVTMFGPALMVTGVSFSGCNATAAVVLLCLTMLFNGAVTTSLFINHCDIAPNFSGTLMGITNTVSGITSSFAPTIAGFLTNNEQTISQWQKLFWLCVPIYVLPEIFFLIFVSGSVQEWNYADESITDRTGKDIKIIKEESIISDQEADSPNNTLEDGNFTLSHTDVKLDNA